MVTEELLGREEVEEVRVLVRRLPDVAHPKLLPILVEWDQLDRYSEAFSGVNS
ncbi:oxidoreductase, partial [Clostridium perfringens]